MGIASVYVGPYLQLPHVPKRIARTKPVCEANEAHQVSREQKFCSQCGAKVALQDASKVENVRWSFRDFPEQFDELLFSPEYAFAPGGAEASIWLPNLKDTGGVTLEAGSEALELSPEFAQARCALFQKTYGELLDYLRTQPGMQGLQVRFGVVPYSH